MVATAKGNKSLKATLEYNSKDESQLISTYNLDNINTKDIYHEMHEIQQMEYKNKNQTLHTIISPAIEDGQKLKLEDWQKIADKMLEKLEAKHLQSAVYLHQDKKHNHLHIVTNRVDDNLKMGISTNYIGAKANRKGHEIAKEMGLTSAKEVGQMKKEKKLTTARKKEEPTNKLEKMKADILEARKKTDQFKDFKKELEAKGYGVKPVIRRDKISGYGLIEDDKFFKATQIDKELSINKLGLKIPTEKQEIEALKNVTAIAPSQNRPPQENKKKIEVAEEDIKQCFPNNAINQTIQDVIDERRRQEKQKAEQQKKEAEAKKEAKKQERIEKDKTRQYNPNFEPNHYKNQSFESKEKLEARKQEIKEDLETKLKNKLDLKSFIEDLKADPNYKLKLHKEKTDPTKIRGYSLEDKKSNIIFSSYDIDKNLTFQSLEKKGYFNNLNQEQTIKKTQDKAKEKKKDKGFGIGM